MPDEPVSAAVSTYSRRGSSTVIRTGVTGGSDAVYRTGTMLMTFPTTGIRRFLAGLLLCGLFGGPGGLTLPGGLGDPAILGVPGGQVHAQEEEITLEMTTEAGTIEIVLDPVRAPVTVANFMRYVDAGQYNGGVFHRTVTMDNQPNNDVKIEVIQGAVNPDYRDDSYPPNSGFDPIPLERTSATGLKHVDGAISMARMGPDTATSGFLLLHRRPARTGFRRQAQPGRAGIRRIRPRDPGHGRDPEDPDVPPRKPASHAAGRDHQGGTKDQVESKRRQADLAGQPRTGAFHG